MALDIGTLTAKLRVDASGYQTTFDDAKKTVESYAGVVRQASSAADRQASIMRSSKRAVDVYTSASKNATDAVSREAEVTGHANGKLHDFARGMSFAGGGAMALEGQIVHMGHAIVGVVTGMEAPIALAAMAAGVALELLSKHFEGLKEAATEARKGAAEEIQRLRDEAQRAADDLKALARGADVGRIAAESRAAELGARAQELVDSFKATYGEDAARRIDDFRTMADAGSIAAGKVVAAYDEMAGAALQFGIAQKTVADMVARTQLKEHLDGEKAAAEAAERAAKTATSAADSAGMRSAQEQAKMGMSMMDEALDASHAAVVAAAHRRAQDEQDLLSWAEGAYRDQRQAAESAMASANEFYVSFAQGFNALQERFAPTIADAARVATSAIGGSGFAGAGSALGSAAGGALGVLSGWDPTGTLTSAVGGALGSAFGELVDKLKPLQDAGQILIDTLGLVVESMAPLFEPFKLLARAVRVVVEHAILPFAERWNKELGAIFMAAAKLVLALSPLVAVAYALIPLFYLLELGIDASLPYLLRFADGVDAAVIASFRFANGLIDVLQKLGVHVSKFDFTHDALGLEDGDNCFTAATLVATPGGAVRIDSLAVGDAVVAFDEQRGTRVVARVETVMAREVPELVLVSLDDGVIEATAEHPFYVGAGAGGRWVRAASLKPGDALSVLGKGGSKVTAVAVVAARATVFNLTVGGAHTFFVAPAGAERSRAVLVHNKDAKKAALKAAKEAARRAAEQQQGAAGFVGSLNLPEAVLTSARAHAIVAGLGDDHLGDFSKQRDPVTLVVQLNGLVVEQIEDILNDRSRRQSLVDTGIAVPTKHTIPRKWGVRQGGNR